MAISEAALTHPFIEVLGGFVPSVLPVSVTWLYNSVIELVEPELFGGVVVLGESGYGLRATVLASTESGGARRAMWYAAGALPSCCSRIPRMTSRCEAEEVAGVGSSGGGSRGARGGPSGGWSCCCLRMTRTAQCGGARCCWQWEGPTTQQDGGGAASRWVEGGGRAAPGGARAPGEEDEWGGGEMGIGKRRRRMGIEGESEATRERRGAARVICSPLAAERGRAGSGRGRDLEEWFGRTLSWRRGGYEGAGRGSWASVS